MKNVNITIEITGADIRELLESIREYPEGRVEVREGRAFWVVNKIAGNINRKQGERAKAGFEGMRDYLFETMSPKGN